MKKFILPGLFLSILVAAAHAQDEYPVVDVSAGYSFLFVAKGFTLKMNGGDSAVAYNVNHWLALVGDFGGYDASVGVPGLIGETYMAGPRFSLRRSGRFTPFAIGLIGAGHANSTGNGFLGSRNAFAFSGGGGADLALDRAGRFAWRAQGDLMGFQNSTGFTGTVRLSTGIVFRFGKKEDSH